jgi:ATP-dependent DNA ligase
MKYSETELANIDSLIASPHHVLEQKMDGTRTLVVIREGKVQFLGQNGRALSHTAAMQHFAALSVPLGKLMAVADPGELVLDGEILTGTGELYLFDLPYWRSGGLELVQPTDAYSRRRAHLHSVGQALAQDPLNERVKVVRSVETPHEKRALWEAVNHLGAEGVMVKHIDAPYEPGARTKSGLKVKLVKTADVVVIGVNRPDPKHGSFALGIPVEKGTTPPAGIGMVTVEGQTYMQVGGCSAIGKPETQIGDVIEVAYLYWTGSSLYQPRMLRVRTDKSGPECDLAQFPAYSREAL